MDSAIPLLQERLTTAEARAARAQKAWETAKKEVADLTTALRVLTDLNSESAGAAAGPNATVAERQRLIVDILRPSPEEGLSPAELFELYKVMSPEDINIDTFRTTIWRMRDKDVRVGDDVWLVKGANGQYWKVPGTFGTRARLEAERNLAETQHGPEAAPFWDDDDSEPPF